MWRAAAEAFESAGAAFASQFVGSGRRTWTGVRYAQREALLPVAPSTPLPPSALHAEWFELDFSVPEFVDAYPGRERAMQQFAPKSGPYASDRYTEMFSGLETRFDDTIVLVDEGILCEKILLEYKTANSSRGKALDGNAHERLSFQILQYLEVATRFPRCSLIVLTNGAFLRYRNKYHVHFHVQSMRLRAFSWFDMKHCSTANEYLAIVDRLGGWLFEAEGGDA